MNYRTNYCDSKQLLQRHPLRNPPLLRTPKRKRDLECRKWGFKRWWFKDIRGYLRKKGLLPPFSGFPKCSSHPQEKGKKGRKGKGQKRQKKGEEGRFRPISRTGGQTPLKPPFVTPQSCGSPSDSNRRDNCVGMNGDTFFGPAKNHPCMLTTPGCPGTPDPRNSSVEKFLS